MLLALVAGVAVVSSSTEPEPSPYATQGAKLGESLAVLGWNVSASNLLRFDGDYVLLDIDAVVGTHAASWTTGE